MSQTWPHFSKHLKSTADDDASNDVTFIFNNNEKAQENSVKANRGLLSLLSPVFKSMFNNGMKESLEDNEIQIKDADSKSFKLFIQYFYGMGPEITSSNIGILSYLAEKYLVSGLQDCCAAFLSESITIDNLIPVLESLHKYHQNKLFENCKIWMNGQSSSDGIINMFKSDVFINTHHEIVSVLLSGFGKVIDPTILWQCTIKWSEAKGNYVITNNDQHEDDNKDDEKENKLQIDVEDESKNNPKYNKLVSIREHFPFYRLPINVICNEILPLQILTKPMALEVLTHQSYGPHHQLAQYCISHQSLCFPKIEYQSFAFGKNKEQYGIETKSSFEHKVSYTNNSIILFANVPMTSDQKWSWEIFMNKKENNSSDYFGIDSLENTRAPGLSNSNSWGFQFYQSGIYPYINGSNRPLSKPGTKTGDLIRMEFDGPSSQFRVYLNGKACYCFNGVKSDNPLYPSFRIGTTSTVFTVRNLQKLN